MNLAWLLSVRSTRPFREPQHAPRPNGKSFRESLRLPEGIVVRLDQDGNDLNGARHEEPGRRIVTTKPGERIWALGEWHTVAGLAVHSAVSLAPHPLPFADDIALR
jgi:hypothetical protein